MDSKLDSEEHRARTCTFVCFSCRIHASFSVYEQRLAPHSLPPRENIIHPCSQCSEPLSCIGEKLQVPRKDDDKAWTELYKHWQAPGYYSYLCFDEDIVQQNSHFESCKVKNRQAPQWNDKSTGCSKCDVVWQRLPDAEREKWRKGGWNVAWLR